MTKKTETRGPSSRKHKHDPFNVGAWAPRSMPRGDAGTPEREAMDDLLRRTVTPRVDNDGIWLEVRTDEAQREVLANGVVFRHSAPGGGLCDTHMKLAGPASDPWSDISLLCRPRLYGFDKAFEWEVDEEAFSWALALERDLKRRRVPESERVANATTFICCGSIVTVMRAPRGRFPTPWVIADVRHAGPARSALVEKSVLFEAARRIGMNC